MSFEKRREIVSFLMRIMVGGVLIYSGYLKIMEGVESFVQAIMAYKVVNEKIAYYAALFLPWFELYLGVLLIWGVFNKIMIKISILLFSFFEVLLLQAIIRGLEIKNCGCFGAAHSNSIGVEFGLNLIWIFFLLLALKYFNSF